MRKRALFLLAVRDHKPAVEVITDILNDEQIDEDFEVLLLKALRTLTDEEVTPIFDRLTSNSEKVKITAIRSLEGLDKEKVRNRLDILSKEENTAIVKQAIEKTLNSYNE